MLDRMPTPGAMTPSNIIRSLTIRASLLEIFYWFAMSTYTSFMVSTLISVGWSQSLAAGAITACSVIMLLAQPVAGFLIDKYLTEKKLVIISLGLAAVFLAAFPFTLTSGSNALIFANMVFFTLTGAAMGGFLDAWVVGLRQEFHELNYGLIRGSGSAAFAISAVINGRLAVSHGLPLRHAIGVASFIFAVIIAINLRPARKDIAAHGEIVTEESQEKLTVRQTLRLVFESPPYRLLLVVAFCVSICASPLMTLLQLIVPDLGGDDGAVGMVIFVNAISEFPSMVLVVYLLRRFKKTRLILFAALGYTARMYLTGTITELPSLMAAQALQAFSYGIFIPVAMTYLSEIVDSRVRSTAVAIYAATTFSLANILGNLLTTFMLGRGITAQEITLGLAIFPLLAFVITSYGIFRKIW